MHDIVIRGGTIVDGTGADAFVADIAINEGVITHIAPSISEDAKQVINASGHIVTPGWVDVHTHYDGQVAWDEDLEPSATNGVTTLVMGNCGVGFAPVRPGTEAPLIELMEGVEDIYAPTFASWPSIRDIRRSSMTSLPILLIISVKKPRITRRRASAMGIPRDIR